MKTEDLLSSALWKSLETDRFYIVQNDGTVHPQDVNSTDAYIPNGTFDKILCRVSDSTKRLGESLNCELHHSDWWGDVHHLSGTGSPIGVMIDLKDKFASADYMPDGICLFAPENKFTDDTVLGGDYEFKSIRAFPMGEDGDVMITVKNRWFRNINNPRFLGFSKETKT